MNPGHMTFSIIKPNALEQGYLGPMITQITGAGFHLKAIRMIHLSLQQAEAFYHIHKGKEFFTRLTKLMSSGPVVAMILKKEHAVADFRQLIGVTDPEKAAEGTIRKLFGQNVVSNAIHGSDSDENAAWEAGFFFSSIDRIL